jgi:hypothetical protein
MRNYLIAGLLAVATAAALGGCTKEIAIQPSAYVPKLGIECVLVPDSLPKVYLTRSQSFLGTDVNALRDAVPNATVEISEDGTPETLTPATFFNYNTCLTEYFYRGRRPARTGHDYALRVVVDGQTYTATTTTRITPVQITSVEYLPNFTDVYGQHEGIKVNFHDPAGEQNFYRFSMVRTLTRSRPRFEGDTNRYCATKPFLDTEIGRSVYKDDLTDGQDMSLVAEPANVHKKGDIGLIRLQTLDPASARFFDQLDRQKLAQTNPFVAPVFLKTEIPGALGVFGAVNESQLVRFVYPE